MGSGFLDIPLRPAAGWGGLPISVSSAPATGS
jgi:hypothetical protein